MKKAIFHDIRIKAVSGVVPKSIVSNLRDHHFMTKDERLKGAQLTGIREYRKAGPETCASDLCQAAAEALFLEGIITPDSIDAVIFVSQTPDYRIPATACLLQHKLGCSMSVIAFDINLGCSGFMYGIYTACSFIQGGGVRNVLLLCGDTQTKVAAPEDRNVCLLLADAGTATLIEFHPGAPDLVMTLMTDGSRYDKIIIPAGAFRHPSTPSTSELVTQPDGSKRSLSNVLMDGMDVFNFSVTDVVQTIRRLMDDEGVYVDDVDYLILHQANKFMTDRIARKLKFPAEKVLYSLDVYGNTSSASIPLTIAHHFPSGIFAERRRCILSGFGNGLSWGVAKVAFDNIFCPPIGEI